MRFVSGRAESLHRKDREGGARSRKAGESNSTSFPGCEFLGLIGERTFGNTGPSSNVRLRRKRRDSFALRGLVISKFLPPWLAPWAAFFRRFAAGFGVIRKVAKKFQASRWDAVLLLVGYPALETPGYFRLSPRDITLTREKRRQAAGEPSDFAQHAPFAAAWIIPALGCTKVT